MKRESPGGGNRPYQGSDLPWLLSYAILILQSKLPTRSEETTQEYEWDPRICWNYWWASCKLAKDLFSFQNVYSTSHWSNLFAVHIYVKLLPLLDLRFQDRDFILFIIIFLSPKSACQIINIQWLFIELVNKYMCSILKAVKTKEIQNFKV
jgi:hypothetical protein